MKFSESPRFFYKFLKFRKINYKVFEGCIFDFACGLMRFALNRDADQFKNKRFLVDGSHWTSKKKFRKQTEKRSGHSGCSESFNFNVYKQHISESVNGAKNSQGREQMHSVLDKLCKSLRQKNYPNFMAHLKLFFAIRNLVRMGRL